MWPADDFSRLLAGTRVDIEDARSPSSDPVWGRIPARVAPCASTAFAVADALSGSGASAGPVLNWQGARRVLVLQGGGALGSYQAGVYEALERHALTPDWVAGVSIGAINAALIAGNPPERRLERLQTFWEQASSGLPTALVPALDGFRNASSKLGAAWALAFGAPGFFTPRFPNPFFALPGTPAALSFYDSGPLQATLERLVDFKLLNSGAVRLSVGAVNVLTGNLTVFDNTVGPTKSRIGPEHIMASGALPPGLPPVLVDGESYWDGGLVSNTPLQFVLDAEEADDLLIFQVDLFSARGPMPRTLAEADEREKDIRYSSRTRLNTDAQLRIHKTKVALRALLDALPAELGGGEEATFLRDIARENAVSVVQLIYRKRAFEGGSKDYEFSRQTMLDHWSSGVADVGDCVRRLDALLAAAREKGIMVVDPGRDRGA